MTTVPCLMWAETGEGDSFNSDNHKTEQTIEGVCDLYTKTEFDPLVDSVQSVLETLGVAWILTSVQYEEQTNLIHYQWTWEVIVSGDIPSGTGDG